MAQRLERTLPAEPAEIGREDERQRLSGAAHAQRADQQQSQDAEQHRHQQARRALDAPADAAEDHDHRRCHEQHGNQHGQPPVGSERIELGAHVEPGGKTTETPSAALEEITQAPTGDHAVVAQDHETGQHAQPPDQTPGRADRLLQCADGALLGLPTDHDLGDHDGQADQRDAYEVDQDECTALVVPGDVRKFPQVAQADGAARCSEHKTKARAPMVARLLHGILLPWPGLRMNRRTRHAWSGLADLVTSRSASPRDAGEYKKAAEPASRTGETERTGRRYGRNGPDQKGNSAHSAWRREALRNDHTCLLNTRVWSSSP